MRTHRRLLVITVALSIAVSACGGDGDDTATGAKTKDAETAEVALGERPDIPGLDGVVKLHDPDGDAVPVFSWEPFEGATTYVLSVFDDGGAAYWVWEGEETSVPLGGGAEPADPAAGGPTAGEGFSWMVAAYDADGGALAVSERRALSS